MMTFHIILSVLSFKFSNKFQWATCTEKLIKFEVMINKKSYLIMWWKGMCASDLHFEVISNSKINCIAQFLGVKNHGQVLKR